MRRELERFWHATPLPYLPRLLESGALLASDRLPRGIRPRPTALRRRRQLGLTGFIHLSFAPVTPLLVDKLGKGYPHALLAFPASLLDSAGAGLLPWNTKRWLHREAFRPVTGDVEKAIFLHQWRRGAFPSAELLVPGRLSLAEAEAISFANVAESAAVADLAAALGLAHPPLVVAPERFPSGPVVEPSPALLNYFAACRQAGAVLDPPDLPFD